MWPWLVWLSGLRAGLQTKGSPVQFPVRAHAWVAGQGPSGGCGRGNHTLIFLSFSFSLPSPLSKNKNKWDLKKYIFTYWFDRERERERERERDQFVVLLIYAFIGWFLYVPWWGIEPTTLAYGDNTLTTWATQGWYDLVGYFLRLGTCKKCFPCKLW